MTTAQFTTRKSYPQDWPAYNAAQTAEKDTFVSLLCAGIAQPDYSFRRPSLPLADMAYAATMKVYTGFSARRFNCDVQEANRQGLTNTAPSFTSVNRYIADPDLTPILTHLIERSAAPLSIVESQFAADSSGFSTCRFDHKWGKEKSKRHWLKAHIVIGTRTNVITAVEVTQKAMSTTLRCCLDCWIPRPDGSRWPRYRRTKRIFLNPTYSALKGTVQTHTSRSSQTPRARVRPCGSDFTPTSP